MTQTNLLTAALEHQQAGRARQAEELYRQILAADPNHPDALHRFGVLCLATGRGDTAVELLTRATELRPNHAEYLNHLGGTLGTLGRNEEAVTVLRRAVQVAPRDAVAHVNLASALTNLKRTAEAVQCLRQAVAIDPHFADAHNDLGSALRQLERFAEAEAAIRDALRVRPGYVKALVNLGCVLRDQRRYDEAVEALRSAAALDPNYGLAILNLGVLLRDQGHFVDSVAMLRRAVEMMPAEAEPRVNLGTSLHVLAHFDEARACYDEALRLDPQLAAAHFGRSILRLREGDFAGGFEEYEWRWRCTGFPDRGFTQPRWDGSRLEGRTILLCAEQGLGDTMNFVRFSADAKQSGGQVIVECQPDLVSILASCPTIERVIAIGAPLPRFDVYSPLMSLPGVLKLTPSQFWRGPYLHAQPRLVDAWRDRLAKYPGFRVGLCWRGNPDQLSNRQRSIALARLAPLAAVTGVRFFSVQKGADPHEMATAGFEVIDLRPDFDQEAGAFLNAAAIIKNLDLMVTCDTAIAHLAGAMEAPVWMALSAQSDWRWLQAGDDTAWYPSMRLVRQRQLDQWDDVFERMADDLATLVAGRQ